MVRHHVKTTSNQKHKKAKQEAERRLREQQQQQQLDRFAGSSEDENDGTDSDDSEEDNEEEKQTNQRGNKDDDEDNDDNDDASSDEDEYEGVSTIDTDAALALASAKDPSSATSLTQHKLSAPGPVGMAGAMSRILGRGPVSAPMEEPTTTNTTAAAVTLKSKNSKPPVVLSKTITPLQKLRKKELQIIEESRRKRKERREIHLTAMHIPLSVPGGGSQKQTKKRGGEWLVGGDGGKMGKELELERMHKRVATRGVVALFNTISAHQRERAQRAAEANMPSLPSSKSTNKEAIKDLSKHSFLDLIKQKSQTDTNNNTSSSNGPDLTIKKLPPSMTEKGKAKRTKDGWNALKDDFMMNSKLKDWDKQFSDEEEDSLGGVDDGDDSGDEDGGGGGGGGGARRRRDEDDIMDDDDSSDEE